jgi:hypothetical protein
MTDNNKIISSDVDLDYIFEELDTSWLHEFEKIDKEYNTYYTEDLLFVRVNYVYVNLCQEITNLGEDKYIFKTPNVLTKEDLIGLIKRNNIVNNKKYSLLSILKYNINIEPHNLKTFFRSKNKHIGQTYLQSVKHIDNIMFDKTISMFQDLNNIMIIFIEKDTSTDRNKSNNLYNVTKRIYINGFKTGLVTDSGTGIQTKYKKTRRNLFKDN